MKKVLVLDRGYTVKFMKSNEFEVIVVSLEKVFKRNLERQNLNVVACFEEEYNDLPIAEYDDNYLIHSWDSDRYLKHLSMDKRREILGKEITFWGNIFDKYKPSCIVNEVVTIEFMEVMFIEAQKRGIPYYRWGLFPIWPNDIWLKDQPFNNLMSTSYWNNIIPSDESKEQALQIIKKVREKKQKPYYIKGLKDHYIADIFTSLKGILLWNILLKKFKKERRFIYENNLHLNEENFRMAFNRLFFKYDKFKKEIGIEYFYYPLHLEPEATIEYYGYYFNDQAMLIDRIAHSLKVNQKLIVKEHPQQLGALALYKYRNLKKKHPNLIYLRGDISSYDIFPEIKCLVTLNGTAGYEAWICQKPVIVFGDVFYRNFPGINACDDFKQLYDIIRNDKYKIANDEEIIEYIARIFEKSTLLYAENNDIFAEYDCLNELTKQVEAFIR